MTARTSGLREERRQPMGVTAFEQLRAERGATPSTRTPVIVRNLTAETIDREWLHQRLGFKLGKFAASIDGTDVFLADESGPSGAPLFRATVQLRGPQDAAMTVTARGESARTAIAMALRSCERGLRRRLTRRQSLAHR